MDEGEVLDPNHRVTVPHGAVQPIREVELAFCWDSSCKTNPASTQLSWNGKCTAELSFAL